MKKITILSGKGGVGKTSLTASLALVFSEKNKVTCVDCDVDASNLHLLFGLRHSEFNEWEKISTNKKPVFNLDKDVNWKKCAHACYFNAIKIENNKPILREFACEGCGVCKLVCPDAIEYKKVYNAKIGYAKTKYGFNTYSAQLEMGESGSGKVVSYVRRLAEKEDTEIMLIDAAAGIGCPVIASVSGVDYVIAITEPSPSGFSDLKRVLEMVNHFNIDTGIVINKYDLNENFSKEIENFARRNKIPILGRLPYSKDFIQATVEMKPFIEINKEFESDVGRIISRMD